MFLRRRGFVLLADPESPPVSGWATRAGSRPSCWCTAPTCPCDDEGTFESAPGAATGPWPRNSASPCSMSSTNYRSGALGRLSWPDLTHAACLAACASSLGGGSRLPAHSLRCAVLVGAPALGIDAAHRSAALLVEASRRTRRRAVVRAPRRSSTSSTHPAVRSHLRVCWRSKTRSELRSLREVLSHHGRAGRDR